MDNFVLVYHIKRQPDLLNVGCSFGDKCENRECNNSNQLYSVKSINSIKNNFCKKDNRVTDRVNI